jgi:hypothetical protein
MNEDELSEVLGFEKTEYLSNADLASNNESQDLDQSYYKNFDSNETNKTSDIFDEHFVLGMSNIFQLNVQ